MQLLITPIRKVLPPGADFHEIHKRRTALCVDLLHGMSLEWDNRFGKYWEAFLYASKQKNDFHKVDFHDPNIRKH